MFSRYVNAPTRGESPTFNVGLIARDLGILIVLSVLLTTFWPLCEVPTGMRGVITVGGEIKGIQSEGFKLLWPWEKLSLFNVRNEKANVENAEGATSDTQPVHVSLTVRYSILPNKVSEVFEHFSKDGDLGSYVDTATRETFKAVTARYTAVDLIAQRSKVSADIKSLLETKVAQYGASVTNIDVTSFLFSPSYMEAINNKVTQQQAALAAEQRLNTVRAEQQQKVLTAEAEANAIKAKADGDAYAQLKNAQAQAESLRIQNAALAQNRDVLELRRIEVDMVRAQKWKGDVPTAVYAGAPIPFLDVSKQYGSPTPRQ